MNNIQHFSKLKDKNVADDICGANGSSRVYGSALFYNGFQNSGRYTGFGLFKDNVGNLIIALDENMPASQTILKGELLGFSSKAQLLRECPVVNVSHTSKNIWGNKDTTATSRAKNLQNGIVYSSYSGNWGGEKPVSNSFYDVLTNIESKKIKFSRPIILYQSYSDAGAGWNDILNIALSVASSMVSAGIVNLNPAVLERSANILKVWGSGKALKEINLNDAFETLKITGEIIAPTWTKGAVAKIEKIKDESGKLEDVIKYGKYLNKAKSGYDAINSQLGASFMGELQEVTGVDRVELQKFTQNIREGNYKYPVNLTKINGSLQNANKILANVNITAVNELVKAKMNNNQLVNEISSSGLDIYAVPVINNILQSGTASTILQGVIGVDKIVPAIIKKQNLSLNSGDNYKGLAGMIGASFGYVGPEENFDIFTKTALRVQATEYAVNKIPFVLPDTIPPQKREEWAKELRQDTGANVMAYDDSWDWDSGKRKWIPLALAVGIGGYFVNKKYKII
jgi:hypothetical protein